MILLLIILVKVIFYNNQTKILIYENNYKIHTFIISDHSFPFIINKTSYYLKMSMDAVH
jgi:hypothetical protein